MRHINILLFCLVMQACKAQVSLLDFQTKWYEVQKRGIGYAIIDCNSEGEWFTILGDSIFNHGVMEDSRFKIQSIHQKNGETNIVIEDDYIYSIQFVDKQKGIIQRREPINRNRYFVDQAHLATTPGIKGSEGECITNNDFEEVQAIPFSPSTLTTDGRWKRDCEGTEPVIVTIRRKEAFMEVLFNQVYIGMTEIKRYDFENGIAYRLKQEPEDKGTYGVKLPWKKYLNNKPIAYIKIIDSNTAYFYWYGFYNSKTHAREITETSFMQQGTSNDIIIKSVIS